MTLPAILFGILISTLIGAAFHLWKGGKLGKLLLYIVFSWSGFWVGHIFANRSGLIFLELGPLHLGFALLGSIIVLGIGYWLSLIKVEESKSSR